MHRRETRKIAPTDRAYHRFIASVNTLTTPIERGMETAMDIIGAKNSSLFLESGGNLEHYLSLKRKRSGCKVIFQNGDMPKDWLYAYENELLFIEKTNGKGGIRYVFSTVCNDFGNTAVEIEKPEREHVVVPTKLEEGERKKKLGCIVFSGRRLGIETADITQFSLFMASVSRILARIINERFDPLTRLSKRLDGKMLIQESIEGYAKNGKPFSIISIDLNDFKGINDLHGHKKGDEVLRETAELIRGAVRSSARHGGKAVITDRAFRWGGDEMLVILNGTEVDEAKLVAERIRREMEAAKIAGMSITCSLGVADITHIARREEMRINDYEDLKSIREKIIHVADLAMYEGKKSGKNAVVIAKRIDNEIKYFEYEAGQLQEELAFAKKGND